MNGRIRLYACLALMWGIFAGAIFFGLHDRFLGVADEWKRYLAMGLCGLMFLWNLVRIYAVRQAQRARAAHHEPF